MINNTSKNSFLQALYSIKCQSTLQMLNFILYKSTQHQSVFISQRVLGSVSGVRREAANIKARELHERGLVQKTYREWTSCIYKINPLFYILADELKHLFPALKIICRKRLLSAFLCASFANRTPILEEEDYFNNPSITIAKIDTQSWKIDKNLNFEDEESIKGREFVMKTSPPSISPVLQAVTDALKLTESGQIKLLVFPEQALEATFAEYSRKSGLKDPYLWFTTYAKGYCLQHNLHIDWDLWPILKNKYNITKEMPSVKQPTIKKPVFTSFKEDEKDDEYYKKEGEKVAQAILKGELGKGFEFPYFKSK